MNILHLNKYYQLIKIRIIEQAKFTYFPFVKQFEIQRKMTKDAAKNKQTKTLKILNTCLQLKINQWFIFQKISNYRILKWIRKS